MYKLHNISPLLSYQSQGSHQSLFFEEVELASLTQQYGTPLFAYSTQHISDSLAIYQQGFAAHAHDIYYSVKVNSNIHVLKLLHGLGAKFDVVSQGELQRVMHAGAAAQDCVFAGVGKTADELTFALQHGIGCINVESVAELHRLNDIARSLEIRAPISLRINPNIDAKTHPYISTGLHNNKFGIVTQQAYEMYQWAHEQPYLQIKGISCHIGSQLIDLSPLLEAAEKIVEFAQSLQQFGINIEHLDFGGGIGISYQQDDSEKINASAWQQYFTHLTRIVPDNIAIHIEPGRSIIGNAGVLLMQVQYLKQQGEHHFAIVDAAMNDLIRPALYQAEHQVVELNIASTHAQEKNSYDVVGPVCESADFLAHNSTLAIQQNDALAILSAGAYSFCMSSNYNSRLRAAEILIDGSNAKLIRQRETFEQLIANEIMIEGLYNK